ncbi:hypothetical protein Tco_0428855, partial [Tanacetum coccineum]
AKNEMKEDLEKQVLMVKEKEVLVKKLKKQLVLAWILVFVEFMFLWVGVVVFKVIVFLVSLPCGIKAIPVL